MILDYINSLLELSAFYLFVLFLSGTHSKRWDVLLFTVISLFLAAIFIFETPSILLLNSALFILCGVLVFRQLRLFQRIIFASCAILIVILLEFTGYSFLPKALLQTHWGNFVINLAIVTISLFLYLFSRKAKATSVLSAFIGRYWYIVISLLIVSCFLGQLYLSRTTDIWWKLPAIVGLIFLIATVILLSFYIYVEKKQNDLQN